jgi:polyribonucleotide nucleotidyltransferase
MVESQSKEVSDDDMMKSLEFAHGIIKTICKAQLDFIADYEKNY